MSDSKTSYHQIVKTTSLFGGVQFLTIIISIIRTKLIAVFIGPTGMGIVSLLNSAINIIGGVTNLGIETSGVKHISSNYKNNDLKNVSTLVAIVKKLTLATGILGCIVAIIFSRWLSQLTFGNSNHIFSFVFISITLLFRQLMIGQLVVLQGLRRMKLLAKANFYGNSFGLLFSIPLYYYYRIDAIVPSIIVASLASLLFSFYYSKKIQFEKIIVSNKQLTTAGKSIIKLGILLTLSGLLTLVTTYLIQIYVGKQGGIEQVGFYNAGFTLLNSYVGIIFTAMSTDYFPRLASISDENEKVRTSVIQQSFISILIITPIIILFLTLIPLIVKIIYTPAFISIIPMVCFGILAMLFKAVSWSMGYILIAKGDSKMFMKTAVGFNIISLFLNVLGYYYYGLEGLGFSFFVYYLIHFFGLKIITKKRYDFYFDNDFYKIYLICILMCIATFLFRYIPDPILKYSLMSAMVLISFVFVLFQMNKMMELKGLFNAIIKRKND
ncbi:oligosaccharide flippase family protein [Flavobacterium gawalongense]|uniref:Oligosaccharide flippase family protein n=1 Tax=Flavobacterium gawalongense TaxID=2594432 RepID=A0A553BQV5_9FLAO|nr:oligosaccharide flippase family protein [Flavobacterium gawalongense]TRX00951.1 oligosaccharide flippase family protein [Flavobacterium gawalongense]TRX05510.1 oligosaccharide flippase family protein [Flavobacterium gawalongense]TRX10626.1 oligosaccharide flippase family protein [Flavobacterium gawalongense]TRX11775.1 oligosaccharide flippase family protein [Flavobacterium gawalongense]TRX29567.1 oligosaccharide flippase family protein [Flavobacterium gawalongense]